MGISVFTLELMGQHRDRSKTGGKAAEEGVLKYILAVATQRQQHAALFSFNRQWVRYPVHGKVPVLADRRRAKRQTTHFYRHKDEHIGRP